MAAKVLLISENHFNFALEFLLLNLVFLQKVFNSRSVLWSAAKLPTFYSFMGYRRRGEKQEACETLQNSIDVHALYLFVCVYGFTIHGSALRFKFPSITCKKSKYFKILLQSYNFFYVGINSEQFLFDNLH